PWRPVAGQDASRARLSERPPLPERPALRARQAGRDESVPLPAALPRLQRPDPASVPGAPARGGGEVDAGARRSVPRRRGSPGWLRRSEPLHAPLPPSPRRAARPPPPPHPPPFTPTRPT